MTSKSGNLPISILARLRNQARTNGRPPIDLLRNYANERFLYRLSASPYQSSFVLKGGLMLNAWEFQLPRATRDIDFRAFTQNSIQNIIEIFRSICLQSIEMEDGVIFDPATVTAHSIIEDADYAGIRVEFRGNLGKAELPMQVDLGFSDVITPLPISFEYPTVLGMPKPRIMGYPPESVVAEKFQAMVFLGAVNSRMKDFYDVWFLSRNYAFDGVTLALALKRTFEKRGTAIPLDVPLALTDDFVTPEKLKQWHSFLNRFARYPADISDFASVISQIRPFILPPVKSLTINAPFFHHWSPRAGWQMVQR